MLSPAVEFFSKIFIKFFLLIGIVIKRRYYFFADDFSAFGFALGLAFELSLPPWFQYLCGFFVW